MSWTEIMTPQPLFENSFILRRLRVADFANIIKIATMFIKTTFEVSKNVLKIRSYVSKCNLYQYF